MGDSYVIAIDGPAGSGKSTVARQVAGRLGILYLDSGAIYRAITLLFIKEKLDFSNQNEQIRFVLDGADIRLLNKAGILRVTLNDVDVTDDIRSREVTLSVAKVAESPIVRHRVTDLLRKMAQDTSVVMDGRDIGTAVFPHADLKIYLTASLEERARRRFNESSVTDHQVGLETIKEDIAHRDIRDSQRKMAPLSKAADAIEIDTTRLTIEQGVEIVIERLKELRSQC